MGHAASGGVSGLGGLCYNKKATSGCAEEGRKGRKIEAQEATGGNA